MTGFNNSNQVEKPDYTGIFLATVVSNADPNHRQRIKVSIPELLTGAVEMLPWISPILDAPFGITGSAGVVNIPVVGSSVLVQFQNGDLHYGLAVGSLHTGAYTPNAALLVNYPNRRGWSDPAGNLFWVDNTPGSVETHYQHPSGATIHIANDGTVTATSPTKVIVNATTEVDINTPLAKFSADVQIVGDLQVDGTTNSTGAITTPADVTAVTTSLRLHWHTGVRSGGDLSGPPPP